MKNNDLWNEIKEKCKEKFPRFICKIIDESSVEFDNGTLKIHCKSPVDFELLVIGETRKEIEDIVKNITGTEYKVNISSGWFL